MNGNNERPEVRAGLDLGDKYSYLCLIDQEGGEVKEEGRDKRRTLRSSLQHPSSAPKAAGGAGSSLKRDSGAQREGSFAGGEDYGNSGGATLKWLMARALVARTRFGSNIR